MLLLQGAGQLFQALDKFLQEKRMRFSQLFANYDDDKNGGLDASELSRLVAELLPQVRLIGATGASPAG